MSITKKWGAKLVAIAAASCLALAGCGGGKTADKSGGGNAAVPSGTPAKGGVIKAAIAYEGSNFHPSSTSQALPLGGNLHVVEGLYELDMRDYKPYRALAKTDEPVKVSDTEYEVQLRDGAKFSTGDPVTADDVVKSFERTLKPGNIYVPMLSFIDKVEKKNDTTVTIKLKHPFSLVKNRLPLVKIVPAKATDDELTKMPVGTGPWKYESIDGKAVKFVPNTNYNGKFPATADKMEWQILKDDTARTTAFQQGTVDVIEAAPADAESLIKGAGGVIEAVQGFNLPFLLFNTEKAPFNNNKVRQAFFYAIDTDKLINNALSGKAKAAKSFLAENNKNFHEAKVVYKNDPEKAKQLLKEAGVTNLSITLETTDHPWITALAPQIKNDLEKVGIKTEIKTQASASLYSNKLDIENATFDVALAPGDPSVFGNDPDLLMNWWYGDNVWTQKRTHWKSNPKFAELHKILDKAVTLTGDEQQKEWNKAFDLLSEEVPLYPLFHRQVLTAYNKDKVTNFAPISTTGLDFINAGSAPAKK
ncbi:ABC transporter substrate-binding protein [Actinotignum urinale]|uniref:ABC transporter substrate-binding protein n=1 Tax=Actinotignum urinale TaxID=190146 RepID=UPI00280BF9E8|nr:ABC transporter substrate-binding protein [Actinotignum urinale]